MKDGLERAKELLRATVSVGHSVLVGKEYANYGNALPPLPPSPLARAPRSSRRARRAAHLPTAAAHRCRPPLPPTTAAHRCRPPLPPTRPPFALCR